MKIICKTLAGFRDDVRHLEATLSECIMEMDRLREIMKADDIIIARSQARTQELTTEIKAMRAEDERRWKNQH